MTQMEILLFGVLSLGGFTLMAAVTVAIHMRNPGERLPSFLRS